MKKVETLTEEFEKEKGKALSNPLGIAFITFEIHQMAKSVHDKFNTFSIFGYKPNIPKSSLFTTNHDMYISNLSRLLKTLVVGRPWL